MESVSFQSVKPSDFEFISSMQNDRSVTDRLSVDLASITVAKVNDQAVGFIKYSQYDEGVYEIQFAVGKEFRGMGYGTMILGTVTDNLFKNLTDCEKAMLVIKGDNIYSAASARKCGYSVDYDMTEGMVRSGELTDGFVYSRLNPYIVLEDSACRVEAKAQK